MSNASGWIHVEQVNAIIALVNSLDDDGDSQINILARAFVAGCQSMSIKREHALSVLGEMFEDEVPRLKSLTN